VHSAELAREVEALREEVGVRYRFDNIIGHARNIQKVLATVSMVAPLKTTVLITGESGTARSSSLARFTTTARASTARSSLSIAPHPESLLENELFGHERGAFTDAYTKQLGQFENADNGTLFLDEIGDMQPSTQAKILRVLEQGEFLRYRRHASHQRRCARHRRHQPRPPSGHARRHLPLRPVLPLERRRHSPAAAARPQGGHSASRTAFPRDEDHRAGNSEKKFTSEALDLLQQYGWPGNVRELDNVIERSLVLSTGTTMTAHDLPQYLTSSESTPQAVQQAVLRGETRLSEACRPIRAGAHP
jgi:DNA-binding NtrC family response regulator